MAQVGAYNANQVMLAAAPREGPMVVSWNVDFTAQTAYTFDLTSIQSLGRISMVQTIFVDNSQSSVPLYMYMATTNQRIIIPPQSQAYMPCVLTNKIAVVLQSTSGLVIPIQALNVAMNATVWSVNGAPTVVNGALQVADTIMDSTVNGGRVSTTSALLSGDGLTYMPVSGDTRMFSVDLTTAAVGNVFTTVGAGLGWVVKSIDIMLSPDATLAAAGEVRVALLESGTAIANSGTAYLPGSAPTLAAGVAPLVLMRKEGINLTSKTANTQLQAQLSAALTAGRCTVNVTAAVSPYVGG
jgi:hypothetical protein